MWDGKIQDFEMTQNHRIQNDGLENGKYMQKYKLYTLSKKFGYWH